MAPKPVWINLTAWHLPPCMKTVPVAPPFQITEGSRCSTRGFTLPREYQYTVVLAMYECGTKSGQAESLSVFSPSFS